MNDQFEHLNEFIADIGNAASNLPEPIKKNLLTSFTTLCSAAVEIPTTWLQDKAEQRRAYTKARTELIMKSAEVLKGEGNLNNKYFERVFEIYGSKIIKEQINIDAIFNKSIKEISALKVKSSEEIIQEDWLDHFHNLAKLKSSEDMKIIFSKILAKEIVHPGAYSLKTLTVLSQLDGDMAYIFNKLCNIGLGFKDHDDVLQYAIVPFCHDSSSNNEDLKGFDIHTSELLLLEEYGLLNVRDISYNMEKMIKNVEDKIIEPFVYNNKEWFLQPINNNIPVQGLKCNCYAFTHAGIELYDVIKTEENLNFRNSLIHFFRNYNLKMVELK